MAERWTKKRFDHQKEMDNWIIKFFHKFKATFTLHKVIDAHLVHPQQEHTFLSTSMLYKSNRQPVCSEFYSYYLEYDFLDKKESSEHEGIRRRHLKERNMLLAGEWLEKGFL